MWVSNRALSKEIYWILIGYSKIDNDWRQLTNFSKYSRKLNARTHSLPIEGKVWINDE